MAARVTETTFIQRLNTAGGVAPAGGCAQAIDVDGLVPYTADYFFYRRPRNTHRTPPTRRLSVLPAGTASTRPRDRKARRAGAAPFPPELQAVFDRIMPPRRPASAALHDTSPCAAHLRSVPRREPSRPRPGSSPPGDRDRPDLRPLRLRLRVGCPRRVLRRARRPHPEQVRATVHGRPTMPPGVTRSAARAEGRRAPRLVQLSDELWAALADTSAWSRSSS